MERAARKHGAVYVRHLRALARGVHETTMAALRPFLGGRQDAALSGWKHALDKVRRGYDRAMEKKAAPAYDAMAGALNQDNFRAATKLLGTQPTADVKGRIALVRAENVRLIKAATVEYFDQVEDILTDPANEGLAVDELAALLEERGGVSESRAELIARDQTTKLNGALNQMRQEGAGIERYVWSTSRDERVRPTHAELEGTEQAWDDPPDIDGEALNPGEDIQCRCVALPVLPDLDEG